MSAPPTLLSVMRTAGLEPAEDLGAIISLASKLHSISGKAPDQPIDRTCLLDASMRWSDLGELLSSSGLDQEAWWSIVGLPGFVEGEEGVSDIPVESDAIGPALEELHSVSPSRPVDGLGLGYGILVTAKLDGIIEPLEKAGLGLDEALSRVSSRLAATPARQVIPLDRLDAYEVSDCTRRSIEHALKLTQRAGISYLPASLLLAGMAEHGETQKGNACALLREAMPDDFHARLSDWISSYAPDRVETKSAPPPPEGLSPYTLAILESALRLAVATRGKARISARHLLGALLSWAPGSGGEESGAHGILRHLGVDRESTIGALLAFLEANRPSEGGDDLEAWRLELRGEVDSATRLAVYWAEGDDDRDRLDIMPDVEAFARLMASRDLRPPLSVGLFGDWGSGKSFFLRKLQGEVDRLAALAAEHDTVYHRRIAQIEFNAWHFVESNLWASITEHIFRNLRFGPDADEKEVAKRRRGLLEELDSAIVDRTRAEQAVEEAHRELHRTREATEKKLRELEDSTDELDRTRDLDPLDVLEFDEDAAKKVQDALERLGVQRVIRSATELRASLEEIRGLAGRGRLLWMSVVHGKDARKRVLWLLAVLVAVPVVGIVLPALGKAIGLSDLVQDLSSLSGQVVVFLGGASAWLKKQADRAAGILGEVDRANAAFDGKVRAAEDAHRLKVEELQGKVEEARTAYGTARTALVGAEDTVHEKEKTLADLAASRRLARFIDERVASDDYRKHLGVLAMVRRDFEKLSDLMRQQRKEDETTPGRVQPLPADDPRRIDRIILYIDDLDRCPPHKVVQVLQAVHLLLAFPLFVVVVAVDARWVSQALRRRFRDQWRGSRGGGQPSEDGDLAELVATPQDYLEKIFQVPFWLRRMGRDATERYLEALVNVTPRPTSAPPADPVSGAGATAGAGGEGSGGGTGSDAGKGPGEGTPTEGVVSADVAKEAGAKKKEPGREELKPRTLRLDERELEFMKKLAGVAGRSPRAVKRLVNVYRIYRAGLHAGHLNGYLGMSDSPGPYREVIFLLAVLAGSPDLSEALFDRLRGDSDHETVKDHLGEFAESLRDPTPEQTRQWGVVSEFLETAEGASLRMATIRSLEPGRRPPMTYLDRVARFSFRVGRT